MQLVHRVTRPRACSYTATLVSHRHRQHRNRSSRRIVHMRPISHNHSRHCRRRHRHHHHQQCSRAAGSAPQRTSVERCPTPHRFSTTHATHVMPRPPPTSPVGQINDSSCCGSQNRRAAAEPPTKPPPRQAPLGRLCRMRRLSRLTLAALCPCHACSFATRAALTLLQSTAAALRRTDNTECTRLTSGALVCSHTNAHDAFAGRERQR